MEKRERERALRYKTLSIGTTRSLCEIPDRKPGIEALSSEGGPLMARCSAPSCQKESHRAAGFGFCPSHYYKSSRYGDRLAGKSRSPAGTGTAHGKGYRVIRRKLEQRAVAEKALGKALPKRAVVHHFD